MLSLSPTHPLHLPNSIASLISLADSFWDQCQLCKDKIIDLNTVSALCIRGRETDWSRPAHPQSLFPGDRQYLRIKLLLSTIYNTLPARDLGQNTRFSIRVLGLWDRFNHAILTNKWSRSLSTSFRSSSSDNRILSPSEWFHGSSKLVAELTWDLATDWRPRSWFHGLCETNFVLWLESASIGLTRKTFAFRRIWLGHDSNKSYASVSTLQTTLPFDHPPNRTLL
jgi:hypothetical protein